jgi:hypothetical protein
MLFQFWEKYAKLLLKNMEWSNIHLVSAVILWILYFIYKNIYGNFSYNYSLETCSGKEVISW